LSNGPVVSVVEISYLDASAVTQTFTDFRLVGDALTPAYEFSWPAVLPVNGAVQIEFSTGYSSEEGAAALPSEIISAMLLLVSDLYENREGQFVGTISKINPTVENLLMPYRVGMGV
ncbi:MAG: head-tail connector protein, partial [Sneathiella sp.]